MKLKDDYINFTKANAQRTTVKLACARLVHLRNIRLPEKFTNALFHSNKVSSMLHINKVSSMHPNFRG